MLNAAQVISLAKYGFLSLVVTAAGFLIANVAVVSYHHSKESNVELVYRRYVSDSNISSSRLLDKDFTSCLKEPTQTFCIVSANRPVKRFRNKTFVSTEKVLNKTNRKHMLSSTLNDFCSTVEPFNITPILIEPSILFCMLSPFSKYNLLTHGYKSRYFLGSKKVVTLALSLEQSRTFDQSDVLDEALLSAGFQVKHLRQSVNDSENTLSGHILFTRRNFAVHIVVLFENEQYLWSKGLKKEDLNKISLLFNKDNAFENFTSLPLRSLLPQSMNLHIPSDPLYFLLDSMTSKFIRCQPDIDISLTSHPSLTQDQLQERTVVVLQELKILLRSSVFLPFWLWADTFSGWLERCNIFHWTNELNFAISSEILDSFNDTSLERNKYIRLERQHTYKNRTVKLVLDCHGLRANIFSIVQDDTFVWYYDIKENNFPKFIFPKFEICSTDVFGQRLHIPCERVKFVETTTTMDKVNDLQILAV